MRRPTLSPSRPAPAPRRLASWLRVEVLESRDVPSVAGLAPDDAPALLPPASAGVNVSPTNPTGANDGTEGGGCAACAGGFCTRHMDAAGNVFYATSARANLGDVPFDPLPTTGALFPLAETFKLHSNPSATKVIYLDFDGHTTVGTFWNAAILPGNPFYNDRNGNGRYDDGENAFTTPAFNFRGQAFDIFEDNERVAIQRIFARVAEAFAPFDVNVTTEDPGVDRLINSGGGDVHWGMRVVFGGSADGATNADGSPQWSDSRAGGLAYVGTFSTGVDMTCYAFTEYGTVNYGGLANNYVGVLDFVAAEAASHEVGHTLGLLHHGRVAAGGAPFEEYYAGHASSSAPAGSSVNGFNGKWAPIMGNGGAISHWSRGDAYHRGNNLADDLAIITGGNGFGYRADDYANSPSGAAELSVAPGVLRRAGIIERNTDTDWFTFKTLAAGPATISIDVPAYGAALNVRAEIYAAGNLTAPLFVSDPTDRLGAFFTIADLAAGTYLLMVDGVGEGNPFDPVNPTGFTDYGSLGQYLITGTINATPPRSISGVLYTDRDGDGSVAGDPVRAGERVYVDANGNGRFDAGEAFGFSDARGVYTILDAPLGTFFVRADSASAYLTAPTANGVSVTVVANAANSNIDLGLAPGVTVRGRTYFDTDGDGTFGAGEIGIDGITVYADLDGNGVLGANEPSAVSGGGGLYTLTTTLPPGSYTIRAVVPAGFSVTAPSVGSYTVSTAVPGGNFLDHDFGLAAPAVASITRASPVAGADGTRAATVEFLVRFALPVKNVTAANFGLVGAGATDASIAGAPITADGGRTWRVAVTTGADGPLKLDLSVVGTIQTVADNLPLTGPFTAGQSYTIDKTAPTGTVMVDPLDINVVAGATNTVSVTVVYGDGTGVGVDPATIAATNLTVSRGATVTAFVVNGSAVTYTIKSPGLNWASGTQGLFSVRLAGGVKDLVGNEIAVADAIADFLVDTVAPTATLTIAPPLVGGALAVQGSFTFLVTYSDLGLEASGIDPASVLPSNVLVGGGATVTGAANLGNGQVRYTVTAPAATWADSPQGFFTIALAGGVGGVRDRLGNPVAGAANFSFYAVDTVAPLVTLTTRGLLNSPELPLRVAARDIGLAGLPLGGSALIDVDLDGDGLFTSPGELGYGTLAFGLSTVTDGTLTPALPGEGRYLVRARVLDTFGNVGLSAVTAVVVDTTPPVLTLALVGDSPTPTRNSRPTVTVTAVDALVGVTAGTRVFLDVDRNGDGDYLDAGEMGYQSAQLPVSGSLTFSILPALPDGTYRVRSRAVDAVGNVGVSPDVMLVIDTAPPVIALTVAARTSSPSPLVTIEATDLGAGLAAGAQAILDVDLNNDGDFDDPGEQAFAVVSLADGRSSQALTAALPNGTVRIRARVTDALGNAGVSAAFTVTVDSVPPAAPLLLDALDPAGRSVLGRVVNADGVIVVGTAEPGSTVTLVNAATNAVLGRATAGVGGNWRAELNAALPDGRTELSAFATDGFGNVGARGGAVAVTLNTTAPGVPVVAGFVALAGAPPANTTAAGAGALVGTAAPVASVLVSRDGVFQASVTAGPDGAWSLPLADLAEGSAGFTARALDAAGNLSGNSAPFTLTVGRSVPPVPGVPAVSTVPGVPAAPSAPAAAPAPAVPGVVLAPPAAAAPGAAASTGSRFATGPGAGNASAVTLFDAASGRQLYSMAVYGTDFRGGVRPVLAQVVGSGTPDIVTAPGAGTAAFIKVFDGDTGTEARSILAYEASFTGGAFVAAADFNGDGIADLVTSPDVGGGPRVRIFDGATGRVLADFFAIDDPNFRGGVRIALGDLDGDGIPELIAGAGFGGGPRVSIYTGASILAGRPVKLVADFFAFEEGLRNGVFVSAADVNGDGLADLAFGAGPGGAPRVYIADGASFTATGGINAAILADLFAGDPTSRGGAPVVLRDFDGDGRADLIVGSGEGVAGSVLRYRASDLLAGNAGPFQSPLGVELEELSGVFVG